MKKRDLIGFVIEIPTSRGLAYAQCTHENKMMGHLLRVFENFYEVRPEDVKLIISRNVLFNVFFPLEAALKMKIYEVVFEAEVPARLTAFPIFKSRGITPPNTNIVWWLWDGVKSWKVGNLTNEEKRRFPSRGIINDTRLVAILEGDLWQKENF